jgi:dienelactone hydrolase
VISEIFGVHEHIADVARRFAKAGYFAVAPELFVRQGDAASYGEIAKLVAEVISKVPDAQVMADLDATVAWAKGQGANTGRLGITGFCWGGRITWLYAAHNPAVKAGVAWYGRLVGQGNPLQPRHPVERVGQLHAPVLGLYGGQDGGIPMSTVAQMQNALADGSAAAKASTFHVYPDAPHAFHADYRPSYRTASADRPRADRRSPHHEDRQGAVRQHLLRLAAEQQRGHATAPVGGHDDEVAGLRLGMVDDRLPGVQRFHRVAGAGHAGGLGGIGHRLHVRAGDALLRVEELLRRHRLHFGDRAVGERLLDADGEQLGLGQGRQLDRGLHRLAGDVGPVGGDQDALVHGGLL